MCRSPVTDEEFDTKLLPKIPTRIAVILFYKLYRMLSYEVLWMHVDVENTNAVLIPFFL